MANFEPTEAQVDNLIGLLDGYAEKGGHHLNVNVLNRETLLTLRLTLRSIHSSLSEFQATL